MPQYFFNVHDGKDQLDGPGTVLELPDREEARREAVVAAAKFGFLVRQRTMSRARFALFNAPIPPVCFIQADGNLRRCYRRRGSSPSPQALSRSSCCGKFTRSPGLATNPIQRLCVQTTRELRRWQRRHAS